MPRTGGISIFALSVIFVILLAFGLILPVLTIQTTLLGTITETSYWFLTLENIICLIGFIIALIGIFLSFAATEYAIAGGLTIFGATAALVASFLFLIRRIGSSTNLSYLGTQYLTTYYLIQGNVLYAWTVRILGINVPVYLSTLQIPLGPIITCFSAFIIVIVFLALLGGYWRRK